MMETLKCNWAQDHDCQPPEWVVSFICNNCNRTGTAEVCNKHYEYYRVLKTPMLSKPYAACGVCHGSLSYMAQHIHDPWIEEHIEM